MPAVLGQRLWLSDLRGAGSGAAAPALGAASPQPWEQSKPHGGVCQPPLSTLEIRWEPGLSQPAPGVAFLVQGMALPSSAQQLRPGLCQELPMAEVSVGTGESSPIGAAGMGRVTWPWVRMIHSPFQAPPMGAPAPTHPFSKALTPPCPRWGPVFGTGCWGAVQDPAPQAATMPDPGSNEWLEGASTPLTPHLGLAGRQRPREAPAKGKVQLDGAQGQPGQVLPWT